MGNGFHLGEWRVEPDLNLISRPGRELQVEPKVMDVLVFFSGHPGEVLSREKIIGAVWPDTHVTDEVLTYSVFELRKALEDDAKHPRIIQTIPRRGYRLIAPVTHEGDEGPENLLPVAVAALSESVAEAPAPPASSQSPGGLRKVQLRWALPAAVVFAAAIVLWWHPWSRALSPTDTILLADFVNTTGDPVFDDTLKHALAMNLSQTPFLNILPEERARETLAYMGTPADAALTRDLAREICIRRGVTALLTGSIARLGRNYVISIEVISGQSGDVIAREQTEIESKERVLAGLGTIATNLRRKLGESMQSLGRFDAPLEQATTSSLDAFKAYSNGRRLLVAGKMAEAIPHYRHALEHDPGFASAYDDLAWCYDELSQREEAAECARKAFQLSGRVSEYERLSIASIYYTMVTGELDKAIETLELMRSIYPRSAPVHNTLGGRYMAAGQTEKAIECFREAIRLNQHPNAYGGLASAYLRSNRLDEAKAVIADGRRLGIDNRALRSVAYVIAFVKRDPVSMIEQVRWSIGKPAEPFMLALQGAAAASTGHLEQSRGFYGQAIALGERHALKNAVAEFSAELARTDALFGNCDESAAELERALELSRDWRVLLRAAYAECACGQPDRAESTVREVAANFRSHEMLQNQYLPAAYASIALARGNAEEALRLLQSSAALRPFVSVWPAFCEATAHLHRGNAKEARDTFKRILDSSGLDVFSPVRSVARLGLARALALAGDYQGSRKAYEEFFASWKDADTNIPLFRRALSEYASLRKPPVEGVRS